VPLGLAAGSCGIKEQGDIMCGLLVKRCAEKLNAANGDVASKETVTATLKGTSVYKM
jgi:hypothetical protein